MARPLSEVSKLPYYGKSFPFIPWTIRTKLRVSLTFMGEFRREVGWLRFLGFWAAFPFRLAPALRRGREGFRMMRRSFGLIAWEEWVLLVIIHDMLARREGKARAYAFAKRAIQKASTYMMAEFYQADRIAGFEDPFEAFWAYHKAMFDGDPNYPNEMIEEENLRVMVVSSCRNCQIATLTAPDLAPLGCDHDITGYKAIEARCGMEFRRPVTLAKDGQPCRFMFFRAGTAPEGIEVH